MKDGDLLSKQVAQQARVQSEELIQLFNVDSISSSSEGFSSMICSPFKTYLNLVSDQISVGSARHASITSMMICRITFCERQSTFGLDFNKLITFSIHSTLITLSVGYNFSSSCWKISVNLLVVVRNEITDNRKPVTLGTTK